MKERFPTEWYIGCKDEEQKEARKSLVLASKNILDILFDLFERRYNAANAYKKISYESPAWQYKLAHKNGQLEELDYTLSLLRPLLNRKYDPD